jgi:hypothetical protein
MLLQIGNVSICLGLLVHVRCCRQYEAAFQLAYLPNFYLIIGRLPR